LDWLLILLHNIYSFLLVYCSLLLYFYLLSLSFLLSFINYSTLYEWCIFQV
jgi:hypothetical protein